MCGIAGFSRATRTSIPNGGKFARIQAATIESRGRHATGFGWATSKDDEHIYYDNRKGPATKVAKDIGLHGRGIHTLMAHTRHATQGDPSDHLNNHPVTAGQIVAVHNGRVDNDDDLIGLAGIERIGKVDSWAIPALLSQRAELAADHATDLLELVQGVAAISWMDADEPDVLHLARLSTRPLHWGSTKRGDFIFASTAESLRRTARLAKVNINDITEVDEGMYLRVEAGVITDCRLFNVNHPPVLVAEDMPGVSKGKGKGKGKAKQRRLVSVPAIADMDDMDWWAEYDKYEAERRSADEILANITLPRGPFHGITDDMS